MGRKDVDGDYVFIIELLCDTVANLLDILARNADALNGRENDLAASVIENDRADLHIVENGFNRI